MLAKKLSAKPINTLDELPLLKTSAEFGIAIKRLENELTTAEEQKETLAKDLDVALFTGGNVDEVQALITTSENHIAKLRAAIAGAETRRKAADADEQNGQVEKWVVDLERFCDEGTTALQKKVDFLELAREQAAVWDRVRTQIERTNGKLRSVGQEKLEKNVSKVEREAIRGRAAPLLKGLTQLAVPLDIHLRDLASPIRVNLPRHMEGQRLATVVK